MSKLGAQHLKAAPTPGKLHPQHSPSPSGMLNYLWLSYDYFVFPLLSHWYRAKQLLTYFLPSFVLYWIDTPLSGLNCFKSPPYPQCIKTFFPLWCFLKYKGIALFLLYNTISRFSYLSLTSHFLFWNFFVLITGVHILENG